MDSTITIIFLIANAMVYNAMFGFLIMLQLKERNLKFKYFDRFHWLLGIVLLILSIVYTLGRSESLKNSAVLQFLVLVVTTVTLGVNAYYFKAFLITNNEKPKDEKNPNSSEKDDYFDSN